jgi:hypothetical protein
MSARALCPSAPIRRSSGQLPSTRSAPLVKSVYKRVARQHARRNHRTDVSFATGRTGSVRLSNAISGTRLNGLIQPTYDMSYWRESHYR